MATAENDSRLYALDLARKDRNAARRHTEIQELHELEHDREARLEEFHVRLAKDTEWNAYLAGAEGSALVTPRGSTVLIKRKEEKKKRKNITNTRSDNHTAATRGSHRCNARG